MPTRPTPKVEPLPRATVLAMGALALAVLAVAIDFTAMGVALPTVEADFDADVSTVQWVVNGYALVFGVLIVPGGRLADMFGRRTILMIGATIFATFSALGGLAPNIWVLIAARLLMGIGGAMMWPAILGLFYAILPASRAALAGGVILGVAGVGNAAGPLIGGVLTQEASWRWILALNVPIAALAVLVTWRAVHAANPEEHERVDYLGIATLAVGLIALLVALTEGPDEGWASPTVLVLLGAFVVFLSGFVWRERRAGEHALVPPSVIANRAFMSVCLAVPALAAGFFVLLFYLPQFFQKILDSSALIAGVRMLPMLVAFALLSFLQATLVRHIGIKAVVTIGAACMAAGLLALLVVLRESVGYPELVPGMVLFGVGSGLFVSSATTSGVTALDPSKSSLAGGILYMFQVAGGAIGLGIATTVFLAGSNRGIDGGASAAGIDLSSSEVADVRGVTAGTETAGEVLGRHPADAAKLEEVVRDSFVSGLRWAMVLVVVLGLVGLAVTALRVGGPLSRFGRDLETEDPEEPAAAP